VGTGAEREIAPAFVIGGAYGETPIAIRRMDGDCETVVVIFCGVGKLGKIL